MWRILLALALMCGVASAQPVVSGGWRPPVGCSSGQVITFNGTAWVCGTPTAFSTANVIPKGNGTMLVASAIVDVSGQIGIGSGASSPIGAVDLYNTLAGQTTAALTDAGSRTSLLFLHDGGGAVGAGGGIVFGNATSRAANAVGWAAIKGLIQNGGGNTTGDLAFSTRNATSDTALTERMRIAANGNVTIQQALTVNGNVTLGDSVARTHAINGAVTHADDSIAYALTSAPAARTSSLNAASTFTLNGTFNTTSAALNGLAMNVTASGTRSAGGFNYTNRALFVDAFGGQSNVALETFRGDNYINQSSGSSGFGYALGATLPAKLSVSGTFDATGAATLGSTLNVNGNTTLGSTPGTDTHLLNGATTIRTGTPSGVSAAPGGTTLAIESANGTANYFVLRSNTVKGFVFANPSNGFDAAVTYDSIASRSLGFSSAGSTRLQVDSSGSFFLGDTANTAVANNVDVLTLGNTGTGQTASTALINASHTGSFNTTAGTTVAIGIRSEISATRSAGSNVLRNVAFFANASGGQENYAFRNDTGDNLFNAVSGSTTLAGNVVVGSAASNTLTVNATTQRGLRNHIADTYFEWNDDWMSTLTQSGSGGTNTALVGGEMEYLSVVTGASTTNATISALAVSGRPGVVRFDTGTANNAALHRATSASLAVATSGTRHSYEAAVRFPALSNSTDGYGAMVGFFADGTNAPSGGNGCFIAYDERNVLGYNSGNQNKFVCACNDTSALATGGFRMDGTTVSSGGFTTVDAPVVANTWYKLRVDITDSVAEFYVDGTKRCQINGTALPDLVLSAAGWAFKKSVGTTARQMDVDYTGLSMQLGAAR